MKNGIFLIICVVFGLVSKAQAETASFWSLKGTKLTDTGTYAGGFWTDTATASAGSAVITATPQSGSPIKLTTNWSSPPPKIDPSISSRVELNLTATLSSIWNQNSGGAINAFIDAPGLDGYITGGATRLTDQNGNYYFEVSAGTRTVTVTVAGNMPSGRSPFEQISVYVASNSLGGSAVVEYVYEWIVSGAIRFPGSTRGAQNGKTAQDGGKGPGGSGGHCFGLPNYWVSTASLNLAVQDPVCMYPGRGPQLAMTHSWNSIPSTSTNAMFGKGWRFAYEWGITKTASGATLYKGSGQELTYTGSTTTSPSVQTPPPGYYDTLTWMGTYWLMVAKDTKWTYRFDNAVISGQTSNTEYRLTSITDSNGNVVTLAYTPGNVIQTITDAVGRITTFTYDPSNRVTRMDAPDGRSANYQYDASGNMVRSVDLLGTVTTYTYDSSGYMTAMTVGDKTATFTHTWVNELMRVTSVKDADGYTTTYSMSGATVTKTDPLANTTVYTGMSEGFTSSITDALLNTVGIEYSGGNPVTITDALGKQTTKTFDARGNVTKITDAKGATTTYAYDANDNLTGTTDALGKTWTHTYDAKSNLTRIASPLNKQMTMAYDTSGQLTSVTNPASKTTSFSYTAHGNVASVTDPLGNQTLYEYDSKGINKTAVTDPRGNRTTFSYDANNRLTRVTNPDATFRTYTYDCCSLTAVTDEKGNTTAFNHDQVLNLTQATDPLGSVTEMMYDGNANLVNIRDPLSRDTTNTYDKANRRVGSTDSSGSINSTYDANGNLTTLADERSKQTQFTYDANGRLVTSTDPLNAATQFVRDDLGRVKQIITAQSGEILYRFDDDGRIMDKSFGGQVAATFTYDSNGNTTGVTDSAGTSAYTYSARNEVTGITWKDQTTATLSYDKAGEIGSIQYPAGLSAVYQYDSRNRMQSVTWGSVTVSFEYDLAGNLIKETRSNGTVSEYSYDGANRLAGFNHKKGTASFTLMQYVRDAGGNIVNEEGSTVITPTLATGSSQGVFNDANQTSTWGSDRYTYDKSGNLSSVTGTRQMSATYDLQNSLLSLVLAGTTSTYAYDGLGARVSKSRGASTTKYHYDHLGRLLFETDQSAKVIANYFYAAGHLVAMQTSDGSVYYYHFDKTGNTLALTNASGNVASAYLYEPFGKVMTQTGTVRNPFTYVGAFGVMDEGNGIYYMKNRYYDANIGKFMQKDPIGFAGGQTNLYAYVGNSPVEGIDPDGLIGPVNGVGNTFSAYMSGYNFSRNAKGEVVMVQKVAQTALALMGTEGAAIADSAARSQMVKAWLYFAGKTVAKGAVATVSWPAWTAWQVFLIGAPILVDWAFTDENNKVAGQCVEGLDSNENGVLGSVVGAVTSSYLKAKGGSVEDARKGSAALWLSKMR